MNKDTLLRYLLALVIATCSFPASLWSQEADPDVLEFAVITDTHQYGMTSDVRYSDTNINAFVDYCNAHPNIDFALFGGDFYNSYLTDHTQGIQNLRLAANAFYGLKVPFYTTRGNHDCNGKCKTFDGKRDNSQIVTDREYYQIFSPLSPKSSFYHPEGIVTDPENPYGNYYYRDFEQQRVRLIVLNNYDRDSLETPGYHGQQMKWLAETALDFRPKGDIASWSFLILGHAITIDYRNNPITRLLHAYVRGEDFFDSDCGVDYGRRYSYRPVAKFIGFIYGHYHEDIYSNNDRYNMISVNRGYATGSEVEQDPLCFDHFVLNTRTHTLEERRIGRGKSRFYSYAPASQIWPGLSFPEADGMGHYTVGGRIGRITHVTSLNDDGPGTLREALQKKGAQTIIFDVNGTIQLRSPLVIRNDSLTIAGQSADQPGITLSGAPLVVNANEVIIRYISLEQLCDQDFGQTGLMVDHVTAHCDTATAISIRRTENVTVQLCRISTGSPTQPALLAGGFKATYNHNYIFGSDNAIKFSDNEGENRWIQIARNLVTGWKDHAMYGGRRQGEFTIHENYFIPDSKTLNLKILDVAEDGTARYWAKLNVLKGFEKYTRAVTPLINDRPGRNYYPEPQDTIYRPLMDPVARPHAVPISDNCQSVAAFNFVYMFGEPTAQDIENKVKRESGSGYRPERVSPDSLKGDNVLRYLDRVVSPEPSIVVLYDNDVHCEINGYPYLAGLVEPQASDSAQVAIVSCGDFLQGGLAGSITNGQAIIDIIKHVGYDAVVPGTHDFDFELGHTRELFQETGIPVVCSNLRDIEADTLIFQPYTMKQYGRRKVAFVGVTTPSTQLTNALSFSDDQGHLYYDFSPNNLTQRVQQAVNQARAAGADKVILLSQIGRQEGHFGISIQSLIAKTTGIDAVLDGHSHEVIAQDHILNKEGKKVVYSQSGERFANIGKLVIDPNGKVFSELIPRQRLHFRDPVIAQIVDSIRGLFMGSADDYAGRTLLPLVKPKEYHAGDTLSINAGNLVTDAMRWSVDADIAWLNTGSIRSSLPAGELSRGSIIEMVPYYNELVTVDVPGNMLDEVVGHLLHNLPEHGGYFSPVSGLKVELVRKNRGFGIKQLLVYDSAASRYVPVEKDRLYHIVTTNYCINIGWRSHIVFSKYKPKNTGILYNEEVFRYINEQLNGVIQPTPWLLEERVTLEQ